ncbi:hypothetical protein H6G64_29185 [Calothrix sp. FACHB-156]|nr:hypothetical protein [Nostoc linckia FACHB-104]MBD2341048.1 hypothetical protein [Calothrix sp. FACHB-156]
MTPGIHKTQSYLELLYAFPPRPITTEDELLAMQEVIDSLIDKSELKTLNCVG